MTETLAQTLTRLTKHLPFRPTGFCEAAAERLFLSAPVSLAPASVTSAIAAPRPARPVQPHRHDRWRAGIDRMFYSLSARASPDQQAALEVIYANEITAGPDFLKVRRSATFGPVPVAVFDRAAASEIMKQARQIENGTYAIRARGAHGGCLGRAALVVLEFFCFVQWPRSVYGMFPSIAHIARQARMSRSTAALALKTLELHGFLKITRRRKIIQTVFGPKVVQDTNGYIIQKANGIGAMALAITGGGSESNRRTAIEIIRKSLCEKEKGATEKEVAADKWGEWGQIRQDYGPS